MVEKANVFPPRSLPGIAENWGRHVEQRIELGEKSEVQLAQKVDNGLRANEGQLSVLAEQMNELFETRSIFKWNLEHLGFQVTGNSGFYGHRAFTLEFTVTKPRFVRVSTSVSGITLVTFPGGGFCWLSSEVYAFTSAPDATWSNKIDLIPSAQGNSLQEAVNFPPEGGFEILENGDTNVRFFQVLPGRYLLGVEGGIYIATYAGGVHIDSSMLKGTISSSFDFSAPDPSITTSDIPQYTP